MFITLVVESIGGWEEQANIQIKRLGAEEGVLSRISLLNLAYLVIKISHMFEQPTH